MNILSQLIYLFAPAGPGSVVSHVFSFMGAIGGGLLFQLIKNIFLLILNWILKFIWIIEQFVLGVMEALELVVNTFLGIDTTIDDILGFDRDLVVKLAAVFRAIFGVAIVLIIVFTIVAMIKQEYANATSESGMSDEANKKGPLVKKLFLGIMSMILLPFVMIILIGALNSVLTSFNNALKGDKDTTIAGQVLATSTFDNNKYRIYAENNKRIPITISAYDADEYGPDETERLFTKIKTTSVQTKLKNTASNIGNGTLLSFNSALSYSNNKLSNSDNYGDYYENFICTAEQYGVLADFIDFCEISNLPFYIKSIADEDIEWKYVDTSVFNKDELSLTISYRDANDLNANGNTNDTYTVTYSMGFDVSSPISDALTSISALLGLVKDEDGNYYTFNEMERDQDSVNIVYWANEKASIHFSENFDVNNMKSWTVSDQIIMYEYYHRSTNNTLGDYTLQELSYENRGNVTLDVYQILYREYYPEADAYSQEIPIECILINGSYYRVVESKFEADSYGNSYYELLQVDGANFLVNPYVVVNMESKLDDEGNVLTSNKYAQLKFTGISGKQFDLNDPTTWSYTDQIIMYEYYSNLSFSNNLYTYDISDFVSGVNVPVYKISDYDLSINTQQVSLNSQTYALINGTYYQVDAVEGGNLYKLVGVNNSRFLDEVDDTSHTYSTYTYTGSGAEDIVIEDGLGRYGIATGDGTNKTADDFIIDSTDSDYESISDQITYIFNDDAVVPDFVLKFSANFNFRDTTTWSFKDYFFFYVYLKYLTSSTYSTEALKTSMLPGSVGYVSSTDKYYFRIAPALTNYEDVFLLVDEIYNISDQNMREMIDAESTYRSNRFETQDELLFVSVDNPDMVFARAETENRTFNFSTDVSYESVNDWTMGDFLLFYLNNNGNISITQNTNYELYKYSYNAICYIVLDEATNTTQKFYAFGGKNKDDSTNNNKIYLNEKYILNIDLDGDGTPDYDNLDSWLNTGLMSYLSSYLTSPNNKNIIQNESGLIQSLLEDGSFNSSIYSLNPLIQELVLEYGLKIENPSKLFEAYSDILQFEYYNENEGFYADRNNLSCWTGFDVIEYVLTGEATGSLMGYIIKGEDGKISYLINDGVNSYAISIADDSFFKADFSVSGEVTSTRVTLGDASLSEYFEANLKGSVISTYSNLNKFYRSNNVEYTYTANPDEPTQLDCIIEGLGLAAKDSYLVYTDGSQQYLYLGSKDGNDYFVVAVNNGASPTALISESALITPQESDIFAIDGSYISFNNLGVASYSILDAIILELTDSDESNTYNIYSLNNKYGESHKYIAVNNQLIDVTTTLQAYSIEELTSKIQQSGEDASKCITMLMRNYYSSYIESGIRDVSLRQGVYYDFSGFNISDVSTWTPLSLILYAEGAMGKEGNTRISGSLSITDDNRRYIEFTIISPNENMRTLIVNVTDLLNEDVDGTGTTEGNIPILNKDNEQEMQINYLRYRVAMAKAQVTSDESGEIVSYLDPEEVISTYLTFGDVMSEIYSKDVNSSYFHAPMATDIIMNEEDTATWNWLDIVYNYFLGTNREGNEFIYYTDHTGKIYLELFDGTRQVFVNFDESLLSLENSFDVFETGTENVSFSLTNTENSLIGLLFYKYSGETSGSVNYISFTDKDGSFNVYMVKDYSNNVFIYIYYLADSGMSFSISTNTYSYSTEAVKDNLTSWNLLDLVIKAATGNTSSNVDVIRSKIYNFGTDDFLLVNNYYINITLLKAGLNIPEDVSIDDEETEVTDLVITLKNNNQGASINAVELLLFNSTNPSIDQPLIKLQEDSVEVSILKEDPDANKPEDGDIKLYFSQNFDFSNYNTWTNADFVLYYLFTRGQMDPSITSFQYYVNLGYVPATVYYLELTDAYGNISVEKVYKIGGGEYNFGSFNNGLEQSIEDYRTAYEHEQFVKLINSISNFYFIRESQWLRQYERQITNITTNSNTDVNLIQTYSVSNEPSNRTAITFKNFVYYIENTYTPSNFDYSNYYYFIENENNGEVLKSLQVSSDIAGKISNNEADGIDYVNLKLSSRFNIEDVKTWTILDYIIIREFARGTFGDIQFDDLKYDFFQAAYRFGVGGVDTSFSYYIVMNGYYYNITDAVVLNNATLENNESTAGRFGANELSITKLNNEYSYNFRVLANQHSFVLNSSREEISCELIKTDTTLSFPLKVTTDDETVTFTYFRELDHNIDAGAIYKVSLTLLDDYVISPMVKKVNWVEKLMNDMQVIYPDLNWANLIANDAWLDTLGEYYSAYASGEYIGTGSSANITAAGLVLSEFLLSIAKSSDAGYADYEYTSVFDDEIIRSLMLSLMGEENYEDLVQEADVFVEMFNVAFAQIMDDVAYERNLSILEGRVDNLEMSVYKAYFATVLLSSDLGEYLYVIATRVLSQYTIYESLAYSSGDFSRFYAYINGYPDENGEAIDKFSYGSFRQLVQYENENLRTNAVPTFTFNYRSVYKSLVTDHTVTDEEALLSLYGEDPSFIEQTFKSLKAKGASMLNDLPLGQLDPFIDIYNNPDNYNWNTLLSYIPYFFKVHAPESYESILKKLNAEYSKDYLDYRGSDFKYRGSDATRFSYILHVYWSIRQNLYNRKLSSPIYLELFYDYICGDISRWDMVKDQTINGASNYIPDYNTYKTQRMFAQVKFMFQYPGLFIPNLVISEIGEDQTIEDYINSIEVTDDLVADDRSVAHRLDIMFQSNEVYHKMFRHLCTYNYFSVPDIIAKLTKFVNSEGGDMDAWNDLLTMRDEIQQMLTELSELMVLSPGQRTAHGTLFVNFTVDVYENVYSKLQALYDTLDSYITNQQTVDIIEKAAITFTLAQFSANYVEDGFEFSVRNRAYTLNTSISTQRLAEYVYGGQFLAKYGVYAQYTSPTFDGIIRTSKALDVQDSSIKTKIMPFTLLRQFASKFADYTAKLYFLTNLKDTSEDVSDSLLLTDNILCDDSYLNTYFGRPSASMKTSLEYLILDHIISQEELSADTLMRLIFADSVDSLGKMNCTDEYLILLAKYLEGVPMTDSEYNNNIKDVERTEQGTIARLTDAFKITALRRYVAFVQTTSSQVKYIQPSGEIESLSGADIDGYYGIYMQNGYNSFGALSSGADKAADRIHKIFVNVITYLTISEQQSEDNQDLGSQGEPVNFDDMNFKKLKAFLMSSLASYQKNDQETGAENSSRYLTLFNLVSGEFDLTIDNNGKQAVGRTLSALYYYYDEVQNRVLYIDAQHGIRYELSGTFTIDKSTRGTILKLCGIENRPIEELVNLEYNELYKRDGNYDEAKGDVFIVCSYDEDLGEYVPYLATNSKYTGSFGGTNYMDYLLRYSYNIYTNYYDSPSGTRFAYPIIAKGIMTADVKPTAIRTVNNEVEFYRTDISASGEVDESALNRVTVAGETTTVGYVKYVSFSSFISGGATNDSKISYQSSSDITSFVNSNASVYYLQVASNYSVKKVDDFDGISIMDDFSAFFKMSFQMHFMMMMAFITLIPLLFKASAAVLRRILDLIFLVLIGPLCISMNSLSYNDQENQTFASWKKYLAETLLNVFGLVICFNLYYIMVSTTVRMTFVSEGDSTMQKLSMIGGLSFVTARLLNSFIKFIFIIVATTMIQTAADMLTNMITGGKVTKSFGSPLANGENAIESIVKLKNEVVGDLNKVFTTIQDVSSGRILVEAKNALMESLPGASVVHGVKESIGSVNNLRKSHQLYKKMRAKGVDPVTAMAFARDFRKNYKNQQKQKQQRRQQYAQGFFNRIGVKADFGNAK